MDLESLSVPYRWDYDGPEGWWRAEVQRRQRRLAWLYQDGPGKSRRLALDRERCRRDFWFWCDNYCWIMAPKERNPTKRLIPLVGWPRQRELVKWIEARLDYGGQSGGETGIVPKARELGVSYTVLMFVLWLWLFEDHFSALLGSKKEEDVDQRGNPRTLFAKVRKALYLLPPHLRPNVRRGREDTHRSLINPDNGSIISGEATNPAFGQSDRKRLIFVDEAARIDANIMASIAVSTISVADLLLLVYNPGAKAHATYQMHHGGDRLHERCIFEMDWRANPTRGEDFKRSRIRPIGNLTAEQFGSAYEIKYGYDLTGLIWGVDRLRTEFDEKHPDWISRDVLGHGRALAGWDFGSGPSSLVRLQGMLEMAARPTLWIVEEQIWEQTSWRTAGPDALSVLRRYDNGYSIDFPDPAGVQRESDQMSWVANLQSAGLPMWEDMSAEFNTRDGKEWMIRTVQTMLDEGTLRIHRRCRHLWDVVTEWRRNVPQGIDPRDHIAAYIPPEPGPLSHAGHALMYLVAGAGMILEAELRAAGRTSDDQDYSKAARRRRVRDLLGGLAA
ncbi:MAG: hypothetical protein AAGM22_27735 [Acidobacteriota bacterium]